MLVFGILLGSLEFRIWLLFLLPHSLVVFFLYVEAVRESRIERKRQEYFYTQTSFWGSWPFCVVEMFSRNSRNNHISQTKHWNILETFLVSHNCEVHNVSSWCFQWGMYWECAYKQETQHAAKLGIERARVLPASRREQEVRLIAVMDAYWEIIFLWRHEAHFSSMRGFRFLSETS